MHHLLGLSIFYTKPCNVCLLHFPGYAECLISDAIRHGDTHKETMEMANYWIEDKTLVHKLFKVLAPRFQNTTTSYTRMLSAPIPQATAEDTSINFRSVLELRGNPFPPLVQNTAHNRLLIHNVLLDEAKKEFRAQKYSEIAQQLESKGKEVPQSKNYELKDQNPSEIPNKEPTEPK